MGAGLIGGGASLGREWQIEAPTWTRPSGREWQIVAPTWTRGDRGKSLEREWHLPRGSDHHGRLAVQDIVEPQDAAEIGDASVGQTLAAKLA